MSGGSRVLPDQQSTSGTQVRWQAGQPYSLREPQEPLTTADTAALDPGSGRYYRMAVS